MIETKIIQRYSAFYHTPTSQIMFEEDRFGNWVKNKDHIRTVIKLEHKLTLALERIENLKQKYRKNKQRTKKKGE